MATGSLGTTSGPTTPSGQTLAGSTPESERNAELAEQGKILSSDFLSSAQITDLLSEDVDGVQEKLRIFLDFKNLETCLRDAILLDYYVSGFLWAKGMDFSVLQLSKFMALLDMLLNNLRNLHMSLEDSIKWLGEVMAEIGPNHSQKVKGWHTFDVKQANAIIDFIKISLFQHYRLYEFMFYSSRTEVVIGTEQVIEVVKSADTPFPAPLEEGISLDIFSAFIEPVATSDTEIRGPEQEEGPPELQAEADTSDLDPLAGFTIDDVKSALAQVTDDVLTGIQTEINEKLQVQEDAFSARIDKLKKA